MRPRKAPAGGRAVAAALLAASGLLALGCGGGAPGEAPPEVVWGADECSHCRMIVSDPRHAAVARSGAGEEARFDDLGCLVEHLRRAADEGWTAWVRAEGEEGWRPAEDAYYLRLPDLVTPMGSGLAAFAGEAEARAAGLPGAEPLTFEELLAESRLAE